MKQQPLEPQWDQKSMAEALCLVIDEQPWKRLTKDRAKKKLRKVAKQGRLQPQILNDDWAYRLCAASLMQHKYHWFGWEWRSEWAARMATKPWCYPQWDGKKCNVLVVAEQGLGDEIVFASCYPDLAEDVNEAWIEMEPRLIPIMERSMPENLHFINRYLHGKKKIVPRTSDYPELRKEHPIEAFITAGNVPKLYRHDRKDFPKRKAFLVPDHELVNGYVGWFDNNGVVRTGVSWKGRQGEIPKPDEGVSLQYGKDVDHGSLLVPPIDLKWDIEEVFALIYSLGKVHTTTNVIAHMAGALGVECEVVKPAPIFATEENLFNNRVQPWWPYDKNDWYPTIKMYMNYEHWRNENRRANQSKRR